MFPAVVFYLLKEKRRSLRLVAEIDLASFLDTLFSFASDLKS